MEVIADKYQVLNADENFIFGKLYKAKNLHNNSLVYVQVVKNSKYISERFLPNLIDESIMIDQINLPQIAKILDVGSYSNNGERYYFIINEYFEGIELSKIIKGNYMDLKSIVELTKKILKVLELSYINKFYHGSLTEENIFVDRYNNIKIYDYGLTKANKGVNIRKHNYLGFLSPYQININYTDKESDFFALGVILFDSIFKKMPFSIGKNEKEMLKLIDRGIDWNTVAVNKENTALVNIVKKLISRTEKYNNVNEILIDLSKFMYVKADIKQDESLKKIKTDKSKEKRKSIKSLLIFVIIIFLFIIFKLFQ